MFNFSLPELSLILVIALVIFGPGKLPEIGNALGKGIREFKSATTDEVVKDQLVKVEQISEDKK